MLIDDALLRQIDFTMRRNITKAVLSKRQTIAAYLSYCKQKVLPAYEMWPSGRGTFFEPQPTKGFVRIGNAAGRQVNPRSLSFNQQRASSAYGPPDIYFVLQLGCASRFERRETHAPKTTSTAPAIEVEGTVSPRKNHPSTSEKRMPA